MASDDKGSRSATDGATASGTVASTSRTHPLVIVAAGAVTLFSVVGIGVMTGLIPNVNSNPAAKSAAQPAAIAPSPVAPGIASAPAGAIGESALPDANKASVATALPPVQNPNLGQPNAKRDIKPVAVSSAPVAMASEYRSAPANTAAPVPTYAQGNSSPGGSPAIPARGSDASARSEAPAVAAPPPVTCRQCGVVDAIVTVEKKGESSGAGAVIGGLIGGVLGHQVGSGRGKDVATVAGALGGAVVGNQVEKDSGRSVAFEVRVRMEDGTLRTARFETRPPMRTGDRVVFENGRLVRR